MHHRCMTFHLEDKALSVTVGPATMLSGSKSRKNGNGVLHCLLPCIALLASTLGSPLYITNRGKCHGFMTPRGVPSPFCSYSGGSMPIYATNQPCCYTQQTARRQPLAPASKQFLMCCRTLLRESSPTGSECGLILSRNWLNDNP